VKRQNTHSNTVTSDQKLQSENGRQPHLTSNINAAPCWLRSEAVAHAALYRYNLHRSLQRHLSAWDAAADHVLDIHIGEEHHWLDFEMEKDSRINHELAVLKSMSLYLWALSPVPLSSRLTATSHKPLIKI
jgi:hypothetical protein